MLSRDNLKDIIVIEGSDGSGKRTQSNILLDYINTHTKYKGRMWDFPDYESETGRLIYDMLHGKFGTDAKTLNAYFTSPMYSLDRYRYISKLNPEEYGDDSIVVCNRYTMSNLIHQGARLSSEDFRSYHEWLYDYEFNRLHIPLPSLTIFLYVPYEVAYENMMRRYEGHTDKLDINEQKDYLKLVDENIKRLRDECFEWAFINCVENYATGSMYSIDNIAAKIRERISTDPCVRSREAFEI